jgi:isopenicillin N synthase-like dioxygenase
MLLLSLQVSAPGEGVFGAGAHSDYGMLTLLATDEVPGLQVRPWNCLLHCTPPHRHIKWMMLRPH